VLTALVGSGLQVVPFTFIGFLPRKSGERRELLSSLVDKIETLVLFESPKRLLSSLEEMARAFGDSRACVAARELTKLHEEFIRGTLGSLRDRFLEIPPKGELTLVVEGQSREKRHSKTELEEAVRLALENGTSAKDASKEISEALGFPKGMVYKQFLAKSRSKLE
jgi:16S rRNA (cytidine1402-2'-O)-methyltransferase